MSVPLVMRLTVAMTLMPEAGYAEAACRLAGHLADVPWAQEWHVPTSKVVTGWRDKTGPAPMENLFWRVAGPLVADDAPSAMLLAAMPVCGIDGMLVNVADTPANRAAFGCAGTEDEERLWRGAVPADPGGGGDRAGGPRQARARSWGRRGPGSRRCWPG